MNIDWSKAPDGADYYSPISELFYRGGAGFEKFSDTRQRWEPAGGTKEQYGHLIRRPATWTGEGLPPVGTVCEYLEDGNGDWVQVRVVAIDQQLGHTFAVYSGDKGYSGDRRAELFRPIRTPEQIAIEIRSKAITQLMCDLDVPTAIATRAYDKGYRKFEIVEGE